MNIFDIARVFRSMAFAPIRIRRNPPTPPSGWEHFEPTALAPDLDSTTMKARDVPVARTPLGGWDDWPPPVLVGCDEPLAAHAADLRGLWQVHKGPLKGHVERVEQVVTGW